MFELFYMGGQPFLLIMGILTLIFIVMIAVSVVYGLPIFQSVVEDLETTALRIGYVKSVGLFALIIGILHELIGMFIAFRVLEKAPDISPSLVAVGLKLSLITTIYGLFIYVLSFLIWYCLNFMLRKKYN